MTAHRRTSLRMLGLLLVPALVLLSACETDKVSGFVDREPIGDSRAFTLWVPGPNDTCTPEIHNRYFAVGDDGLRYPTWHPPTDPATGCTFGHEHGRDPRGSDLFDDVGPMPFGLANERLNEIFDPGNPRVEDHFGHKVEWENDVRLDFEGATGSVLSITCDVLAKLHQGTHSKDAFTNNLHEIIYHIRCSDRTEMHIQMMSAIGPAGEFTVQCSGREIRVGPATPANSPNGGGHRRIPDRTCVDQNFDLHESWETSNAIRRSGGGDLASFDPYFQVELVSRFYDPARTDITGRPIEVCYENSPTGLRERTNPNSRCNRATANGTILGLTYNDSRSPYRGDHPTT